MVSVKVFRDVAQVAKDMADVVAQYDDVPEAVYTLGKDVVHLALHRTADDVQRLVDDADGLKAKYEADNGAASEAWAVLVADLKTLATDIRA